MKILIIEDDLEVIETVSLSFSIGWSDTELVSTRLGQEGIDMVSTENPDMIILDLGLPDISGFDVLQSIRKTSTVPIIVLTVRDEETDVVKALDWGADEYITKPFRQMELLARIKAVTRRKNAPEENIKMTLGKYNFFPNLQQLQDGENRIRLTSTESRILYYLLINKNKIVPYQELANSIWGDDIPTPIETLRVHIRHLREKVGTDPSLRKLIGNKPRTGYILKI
jgi:DNA-binding response OmpR family regulator